MSQIYDVIQSNVALQKQVHQNVSFFPNELWANRENSGKAA